MRATARLSAQIRHVPHLLPHTLTQGADTRRDEGFLVNNLNREIYAMMTDPIADMFTRLRNANRRMLASIEVPASKLKGELLSILKREAYINNYVLRKRRNVPYFKVYLHYTESGEKAFNQIKQISKPSRRIYVGRDELPIVARGMGIAIVSTSSGVLTSLEARRAGVGGEVMCHIW